MLHVARCKGRDAFRGACRKQASFGGVGDSVPRFCSAHRRTADVYLRHGTCTAEGCATIASFGAAGGGTRGFKFCGRHKEEGDVNLRYQQQKAVVRRKREERHRESEWLMQHLDLDGVAEGGDRLSLPPSLWDPSPLEEDGGVAASPRPPAPLEHPHPHSHSREQEQEPSPPGKLSALDACSGAFPPTNDHAFARDPSFPPPAARARAGDQLDESTLEEGLSDSSGSRGTPPPLSDVRGGSLSCGASLRSRSAAPRGMFAAGCAV
ncbi:hypothetical protein T484DRAFT_1932802 [Baffinella frigidus]|nr:hypothetical protein T484DRAFT_1932802 [Cryptophyta sp. CCMP2293]